MQKNLEQKMQELLDKQEIYELSCRYVRGLDRMDAELVRSVYHDDGTDDRGFFSGGKDEFVDLAVSMLGDFQSTQHLLGQVMIDIEDDVAFGEAYFQAFHRVIDNGLEKDFVVRGRYIDRYEKREGVWKIKHRSMVNDFCSINPATDDWLRSDSKALKGVRGGEDISYQREKLGNLK